LATSVLKKKKKSGNVFALERPKKKKKKKPHFGGKTKVFWAKVTIHIFLREKSSHVAIFKTMISYWSGRQN
jgi:hypothetical protein